MRSSFFPMLYGVIAIILVGLVPCPAMGQVLTKKQITKADYGLWHRMVGEQLSDNGNWVSYRFLYPNSGDTTFVVHTKTMKKFVFPNAVNGQFNGERSFAFIKKEGLVLFDLKSGIEKLFPNVSRYEFSADGQYLITLENSSTLVVRKSGVVLGQFENVTTYEWDDDKTKLVYAISENGTGYVGCLHFKNTLSKEQITKPRAQTFEVFKWQPDGNSVAFYGVDKGQEEVCYYDFVAGKLFTLKSSDAAFPLQMKVAPDQNIELKVSHDGKKVFFGVSSSVAKDTSKYSSGIAVWNAQDKVLYRERALRASVAYPQYLAVWLPSEGIVRQLNSAQQRWVALTGNQDYALVATIEQYEPQYKMYANMDYYLMDVRTGAKELVLKDATGYDSQLDFSPDGRYISYYNKSNWWVYDILKKSHTNLTQDLKVSWDNRINDPAFELRVWNSTDWSKDGKFILCYDYNDIWAISLDGKQRKRLTDGKEKNLRFRFDAFSVSNKEAFNYSNSGSFIYDLSKELILTSLDMDSGARCYYQLHPTKEVAPLVVEDALLSNYVKSKNGTAFIYVKQRYDLSPTLVFKNKSLQNVVVQSNAHQKKFYWGKSEMIHYTNSKGTRLNGALFYPANYDGTKNVPLIVYIYEIVSTGVHEYVNPSNDNTIGFNISNLTTNGYAVLLADIAYEKGNTGFSAADCVIAAAKKVVAMGVADVQRIGLLGHSFGGYETNFILTQTDLFAAAVSGNGISDVVAHYFNYNADWGSFDSWRYENQQFRMGCAFYDTKEAYYRNSPLLHADKITTPLLTWIGKLDNNIRPQQTEALYAAMRRLNKVNIMLEYPGDAHSLFNKKNQEDLTMRVEEWFGYFLKEEPKKEWMKADFEAN